MAIKVLVLSCCLGITLDQTWQLDKLRIVNAINISQFLIHLVSVREIIRFGHEVTFVL